LVQYEFLANEQVTLAQLHQLFLDRQVKSSCLWQRS
jgi:hypothetical protein